MDTIEKAKKLFNLSDDFDKKQINLKYRQFIKKYHPDLNPNNEELMKKINVLRDILKTSLDDKVKPKKQKKPNRWKDPLFPKENWTYLECEDLDEDEENWILCEMCGSKLIRYVHKYKHESGLYIKCGCCCGKILEKKSQSEALLRQKRLINKNKLKKAWQNKKWKNLENGNIYLVVKRIKILIYKTKNIFKINVEVFQKILIGTKEFETLEEAISKSWEVFCWVKENPEHRRWKIKNP